MSSLPTVKDLRQAMRDFTCQSPTGMSQREMFDFLSDQLGEMRREPDNYKALSAILSV